MASRLYPSEAQGLKRTRLPTLSDRECEGKMVAEVCLLLYSLREECGKRSINILPPTPSSFVLLTCWGGTVAAIMGPVNEQAAKFFVTAELCSKPHP